MAMGVSHALSEKAIKKLGLDKEPTPTKEADKIRIKEWDSSDAYWEEDLSDRHAKWYVKVANFFKDSELNALKDWCHEQLKIA